MVGEIASVHTQTAGHDTLKCSISCSNVQGPGTISIAAPVQIEGGCSIGMVKCSRKVMMGVRSIFISLKNYLTVVPTFRASFCPCVMIVGAFEPLVSVRVFVGVSAASSMVAKEFVKYRSSVEGLEEVKRTVEKLGTMSLKKWLGKSQQVHT